MRRFFSFALLGLLGLAATSRAACLNGCCPTCKPIPAPECEDCSCACDHRCHLMLHDKSQQYIDALHCPDSTCCDRIKAAKKLGCRLHADYCCNPAVLDALLGALTCDPCWEVRQAAAESIYLQDARTEQSVLVLYVSSKVDPHYMVRTEAAEALDIITRCRHNCYKDLYAHADDLIKELKKQKFKPGTENCQLLFGAACASCGVQPAPLVVSPGVPVAPAETVPPPAPKVKADGKPTAAKMPSADAVPALATPATP